MIAGVAVLIKKIFFNLYLQVIRRMFGENFTINLWLQL